MERTAQEQKAAAEQALAAAKTKEAKEKAQALLQAAEVALWDAEVARQAVDREKGHREELRAEPPHYSKARPEKLLRVGTAEREPGFRKGVCAVAWAPDSHTNPRNPRHLDRIEGRRSYL